MINYVNRLGGLGILWGLINMDNNTIKIYVGNEFIGFFKVFNGEIKIPRQQFNDIMEELNKNDTRIYDY